MLGEPVNFPLRTSTYVNLHGSLRADLATLNPTNDIVSVVVNVKNSI